MDLRWQDVPPELGQETDGSLSDKPFSTLQAQMAMSGLELHRITGATGREGFVVNVRGSLRTLDTLDQVAAYARCLGVVTVEPAPGGVAC